MTEIDVTYRFDRGLSWSPAGASILQCRSHALVTGDGEVWLVDPFDGAGLDDELAKLGKVAGVIVLLDRHLRGAPDIARRHGVPLLVPPGNWRRGHARPDGAIDAVGGVAGCPFEFHSLVRRDGAWLEQALWWPEARLLVIAETVGRSEAYLARPDAALGVHPLLRMGGVPAVLDQLDVDPLTLLLGHGAPLTDDVAAALAEASRTARSQIATLMLRTPKLVVGWVRGSRRGARFSC